MNQIQQKIEALLFYRNEPVTISWLAKVLSISQSEVENQIHEMKLFFENRGCALVYHNEEVSLMTSPVAADLIQKLSKEEDEKELSKQALETLSIILYKQQITKSEIDYIRGVNSVFILRNLLIRGLITKKTNLLDKRSPLYTITHDTLSFLGIKSVEELPDFERMQKKLQEIEQQFDEENNQVKPLVVGEGEE